MITLYGIPNCDTTKKAIGYLKKRSVAFRFHDYKQTGISETKLKDWIAKVGLETIFNKRSTTWKELSAADQKKGATIEGAIQIMLQHNSIIKRPVIETAGKLLVGYKEEELKNIK